MRMVPSLSCRGLLLLAALLPLVGCKAKVPQTRVLEIGDDATSQQMTQRIRTRCQQCHAANNGEIEDWAGPTKALQGCLDENEGNTAENARARLSCMLLPGTTIDNPDWSSARVGFFRAGVNSDYFKADFDKVYGPGSPRYQAFKGVMAMPPTVEAAMPLAEFNEVKTWMLTVEQGGGGNAEFDCTTDIKPWLKKHIVDSRTNNWTKAWVQQYGLERLTGCEYNLAGRQYRPLEDPLQCFKDTAKWPQIGVFHDAVSDPQGRYAGIPQGWRAPEDQINFGNPKLSFKFNIKILKQIKDPITYWMRSSPDGRYVGNGRGQIEDLEAKVHFKVPAQYDPGFSPDNSMFSYMGTSGSGGGGALFCRIEFLAEAKAKIDAASTGNVCSGGQGGTVAGVGSLKCSNNEPFYTLEFKDFAQQYCINKNMGTYQHQGVALERGSEYVIVRGNFAGNEGVETEDPVATFLGATELEVYHLKKDSTDISDLQRDFEIQMQNEGDWTISPSAKLIAGRLAKEGANGNPQQAGYNIRMLFPDGVGTTPKPMQLEPSKVCTMGSKSSISFEDRFLATYHFVSTTQEQRVHEEQMLETTGQNQTPPTLDKGGSANVYVTDMLTKKKVRVTLMPKGVYALFPHFRADNWLYFLVKDTNKNKVYAAATDVAIHMANRWPTPATADAQIEEVPLPLHPEGTGPVDPPPPTGSTTETFNFSSLGVGIPDNSPTGVTQPMILNATEDRVVESAKVLVDIKHTYIGDLTVTLVHPDGTKKLLHNKAGSGTDDLKREYELPEFAGKAVKGQWALVVTDTASQDAGNINEIRLTITHKSGGATPPPPPPTQSAEYSSALALAIPDNKPAGVLHKFQFNQSSGTVASLNIDVDVDHAYHGDLLITLHHPSGGDPIVLHNRQGGNASGVLKIRLANVGLFQGKPIGGEWSLKFADTAASDKGTAKNVKISAKLQ